MPAFRHFAATAATLLGLLPQSLMAQDAGKLAAGKEPALRPYLAKLYAEGERNSVLNLNQLALAAIEKRDYSLAEKALDESLLRIEAIRTEDANADKARSKFSEEKSKDYKGEPYERAMAFYYRGLLYLRAGDFQNARAAFLNAGSHIAFSKTEKFTGDFGLMNLMASWASSCDGDDVRAKELRANALAEDSTLKDPPTLSKVLVVIESGRGPVKTGTGQYKEVLIFEEFPGGADAVGQLRVVDGETRSKTILEVPSFKAGDVQYQAMNRGGRPIQGILDGKAQFKDTTKTVGTVAAVVGQQAALQGALNNNRGMANMGLAGMFIGFAADIASNATTPAADTRAWSNLPRDIYIGTLDPAAMSGSLAVTAQAGTSKPVGTRVLANAKGCTLMWGQTRSALLNASALSIDPFKDAGRKEQDQRFQQELMNRL